MYIYEQIRIRNTIKENHNTREGSNAVQNAIITQTQNHNEKASPTTNPRQQTVATQTAKVNDTNKNPRLQRDFLSTAPGKVRNRGIMMHKCLSYIFYSDTSVLISLSKLIFTACCFYFETPFSLNRKEFSKNGCVRGGARKHRTY